MTIRIVHNHADGTLVYGSSKGDGVYELIGPRSGIGFRWMPSIRMIGLRGSRDRMADRYRIGLARDALIEAGFEVEVEIDDEHRSRADVVTDKRERLEDRREALERKAERHAAEADRRLAEADRLSDLRPFGQPILIGHHSEKRHRRDLARIEQNMNKFVEENELAREYARRAEVAGSGAPSEAPLTVARRVERAEAELRDIDRNLNGYTRRHLDHEGRPVYVQEHGPAEGSRRERLEARRAQVVDQLAYDRGVLEAAKAEGRWTEWGPDDVKPGDFVTYWGGRRRRVVKVNKKTVSVETDYTWTDKVKYTDVQAVEPGDGTVPESKGARKVRRGTKEQKAVRETHTRVTVRSMSGEVKESTAEKAWAWYDRHRDAFLVCEDDDVYEIRSGLTFVLKRDGEPEA